MFHHHVSTVTQNGQTKHQLYSGPFFKIHNREIIDCVCSSKCPVNGFTDSSGITAVYGGWLYPGLKDTFMSVTHPKLQPKCRWSSCILGNVGPRFLQGRMGGMRKKISSFLLHWLRCFFITVICESNNVKDTVCNVNVTVKKLFISVFVCVFQATLRRRGWR